MWNGKEDSVQSVQFWSVVKKGILGKSMQFWGVAKRNSEQEYAILGFNKLLSC